MKPTAFITREMAFRIVFIALALLLGSSLFAAGALASENCGRSSEAMPPSLGGHTAGCDVACGSAEAPMHCNAKCAPPVDMPNVALASAGSQFSDVLGPADGTGKTCRPGDTAHYALLLSSNAAIASQPLFLINQAFLM